MINKKLKVGNVPNLRFPEFTEEWETKKLGEILEFKNGINATKEQYGSGYKFINVLDILNNEFITHDKIIGSVNVNEEIIDKFPVNYGDILFQRSSETREEVGTTSVYLDKDKTATFGGFVIRGKKNGEYEPIFLNKSLKTDLVRNQITSKSGGSTRYNIGQEILASVTLYFPSLNEQTKIASFLSLIDSRIQTQNKIIEELKLLKNTIRYQLYEQILNQENEYIQIKDTLNYEQPTKYLVTNTDYSPDSSLNPVLTANKAFILGYTDELFGVYNKGNCIIFDDFTMDMKFVDFPFKVKSSAIKILTAKPNVNLKFIFEYLSFLNLSSNEHKRHYISEIEPMKIQLPNYIQQKHVADFLSSIDDKVKTEFEIHMLLIKQKQYLLANLFI
ncbi:restriction endonuclease subunit S [Elizabethkingia anophelis]|uniref:restriction endonuclease subunit S n=1 Tax=Elizabethkingia anophelis TaxID=1117645 RepID=UPI003892296C